MPLNISQVPRGLLSLLGIKSFGDSPRSLSDQVAPTLDLAEMYLQNTIETLLGQDAAPALGSRVFATGDLANIVPQGELWFVWHYRLNVSAGAATAATVQPTVRLQDAQQCARDPLAVTGIAGTPAVLVNFGARGFWAGPGSRFGYIVSAITGAPGTIEGVAQITRLRV